MALGSAKKYAIKSHSRQSQLFVLRVSTPSILFPFHVTPWCWYQTGNMQSYADTLRNRHPANGMSGMSCPAVLGFFIRFRFWKKCPINFLCFLVINIMLGGGWRSLIAMDFYVYHFQYFKSKCLIYSFARLQEYPINLLCLLLQIPKNSMRWRWLPKHHQSNVFYWTTMVTSHPLEVLKVIEIYLQIVRTHRFLF